MNKANPSGTEFTAVLLAGGKSTRMGQDKSRLIIAGVALWQRQLDTLRATEPAQMLISGPADGAYAGCGIQTVDDAEPGLGPLGGLVSAIAAAQYPLVLVLAIDLPRMTSEFLKSLLKGGPVVPRRGDRFEPLAAVYSKESREVFQRRLAQRRLSLQGVVRELVDVGDVAVRDVSSADAPLFDNVNTPEDLAYFVQSDAKAV